MDTLRGLLCCHSKSPQFRHVDVGDCKSNALLSTRMGGSEHRSGGHFYKPRVDPHFL
jgi:hypothetical protein